MRHLLLTTFVVGLFASLTACSTGRSRGGGNGQCPTSCAMCDPMGKCHDCSPGQNTCAGGAVVQCNADGTFGQTVTTCDTTQMCTGGTCQSACDVAAQTHSYIGCDYWPTSTMNPELNPDFHFAVAVANPLTVGDVVQGSPADVTVTLGNQTITTRSVQPGAVEVIELPWVTPISQNMMSPASALMADGAYHLVSTLPVTVYQFNPLEYELPASNTCMDQFGTDPNTCHSYTNDASILLPTTALGTSYVVVARQTFTVNGGALPGFYAVVGTEDGTTVMVKSSAHTLTANGVPTMAPGQVQMFHLDHGSVLEVASDMATSPCASSSSDANGDYCDLGPSYDVTGTQISADKPIAVFGGHACSFVPYNKWACDHLEEQMVPVDTWGQKIVVAQTEPQISNETNYWRVVSGSDGNMVTFDPPVHAPVTLSTGEYVEFAAQGGFQASGTGRTAVAQYMVGENATVDTGVDVGDPSLGLGVPVEQHRDSYDFLTPTTYTKSYVNVVAPMGDAIMLDGQPFNGSFTPIGGTGYGYARAEIPAGAHHMTGAQKFGITVSGIASFTSYLYVGGQNLNSIPLQ